MRNKRTFFCKKCQVQFQSNNKNPKFCCRSCAAKFNNKGRKLTEEHKKNIGISIKRFFEEHPERKINHEEAVAKASSYTRGKYHTYPPDSLLKLSGRTVTKIFKRMDIGCSNCGWKGAACDLHHIFGRRITNADAHENLTYLCPNCHRLAHSKKLLPEQMIPLTKYIGNTWQNFYYG